LAIRENHITVCGLVTNVLVNYKGSTIDYSFSADGKIYTSIESLKK